MSQYIYCFDPEIAFTLIDKRLILLDEKIISNRKCWIFKYDENIPLDMLFDNVPLDKTAVVITNKMFV